MDAKLIKDGGITSALGFQAAGIGCGLKEGGAKDLALIVSDVPAEVAALESRPRPRWRWKLR